MGLPSINIIFKEAANTLIKRGKRGIVALILKDTTHNGVLKLDSINDIPSDLSDYNKKQIQLAMMGTVNPPSKVIAYVLAAGAENYAEAMTYLETVKFNYLSVPGIESSASDAVAQWIKELRSKKALKVKAVLPNCASDNEGIINFATDDIKVGEEVYAAKDYCSRIAGILAGLPLNISSTYQVLPEVSDVPHLSKEEFDAAIDAGKLVLMNDGEKVKIARGVNSLVSLSPGKGESFKKIKIVDTIDMIHNDIKSMSADNYIGKVPNTYDNKCLLITAIKGYFEELENEQLLDKGKNTIGIDMETQKIFLKSLGQDVASMNEQGIKEANTRDKVFLASSIKIVDAIEDISLNINM
jgi:hypothetical protein